MLASVIVTVLLKLSSGNLDEAQAQRHAAAVAVAAESSGLNDLLAAMLPADDMLTGEELLLGIARPESHFDRQAISRKQCSGTGADRKCVRKAGVWRSHKKPKGAKGSYFCGIMQVGGNITWQQCLKLVDDIELNYQTGAEEIMTWLKVSHCRKRKGEQRLKCALIGYGGGYKGLGCTWKKGEKMKCPATLPNKKYPRKVLRWARYVRTLRTHAESGGNV